MGVSIIGTGMYVPDNVVTNDDFTKIVDTSDEWITTRTGIKNRHIGTEVSTCQMGVNAANEAIKNASISVEDIDMVIVSTVTGDYLTPSTACVIANKLGAVSATCMDLNAACAGFVYAVDVARRYLLDDEYKNILIVSTEMISKITDYTDRSTCVLFGDGAGACVVNKSDKIFSCHLGGDASGAGKLFARGFLPDNPFMDKRYERTADGFIESQGHALYMDGREVYKFSTRAMPNAVLKACEKANISPDELDMIIPHQANRRIVETAAKNLKIPMDKFFMNIKNYGNMSSACIPIGIHQSVKAGTIKPGDKICIVGFGAGLVYGAAVIEW